MLQEASRSREEELRLALAGSIAWYVSKLCNDMFAPLRFGTYRECIEHYTDDVINAMRKANILSEEDYQFVRGLILMAEMYCEEHPEEQEEGGLCWDTFRLLRHIMESQG